MNFDASSVWVIASVAGLAIIGFAVYRLRKGQRRTSQDLGKQFLTMGIIWLGIGLAYSIWRDTDLFDIGIFNLGLVFAVAGAAQLAITRARKNRG